MDYTIKFVTTEEETVLTAMKDFLVSINTANLVAATLQQAGYPLIKVSVAHTVAVVAAAVTKSDKTKGGDKSVPIATPVTTSTKVTATNVKEIPAIAAIAKEEVSRSEATPTLPTKTVAMAMGKIAPITNTAIKTTTTATTTSAATTTAVSSKSKGSSSDPLASVPVRTSNKSK